MANAGDINLVDLIDIENDGFDSYFETPVDTEVLLVHRGQIFEEFLKHFSDESLMTKNIKIQMVLPNGSSEIGEDFGGIIRDALSEFWATFYEKCTIGTSVKVPYIRHDFGPEEWRAIARIWLKGYETERYVPVRLAPSFLKSCFSQSLDKEEVLNDFLEYTSEIDKDLFKKALSTFDEVDEEELLEAIATYDSKWLPTKENITTLLSDIAHKEIIQRPAFVAKCFEEQFIANKKTVSYLSISEISEKIKPTVKNCLAKIKLFNETDFTTQEKQVFDYLKKYIKEASENIRMSLFRFSTGSDLPIQDIKVSFISTSGISRVPVARTCSCILELPNNYENFVIFRNEFNNVLSSNIWVMDII